MLYRVTTPLATLACPGCGYDLTGIGAGSREATCPECGRQFDPAHPRDLVPPWPGTTGILVRMCVPSWGAFAAAFVMVLILDGRWSPAARAMVVGGAGVAALLGIVVMPAVVANRLAQRHATVRRLEITCWLTLAALMTNVLVLVVATAMLASMGLL